MVLYFLYQHYFDDWLSSVNILHVRVESAGECVGNISNDDVMIVWSMMIIDMISNAHAMIINMISGGNAICERRKGGVWR